MASSPITSWQIDGKQWKQWQIFIFLGCEITADGDCSHEINICLFLGRKVMTNLESVIKKQIHYFANKDLYTQSYGFSSSHVWMWEFYHKGWLQQNWCFWTVVLEKALESPLDCKEIQPVNPKGNQFWLFIGRTDAEAEAILWPPDAKIWLIGRYRNAGKNWKQEKRTDDEMVGWHHELKGYEFEQALGDSEGQGSLVCYSPWGCKDSDMNE